MTMISTLEATCPHALADWRKYAEAFFASHKELNAIRPEEMPSRLLWGVFFGYFEENAIDFVVSDISAYSMEQEIVLTMQAFEKVIHHFS